MRVTIARRLVVHGRVQGVWFRGWTVDNAAELGLRGWVRNRRDGTVELLVAGDEAAVQSMIERARAGPSAAHVDQVEVEEADEPAGQGFDQRPTI